jgi:uncharacterized protein (DUF2164 family)
MIPTRKNEQSEPMPTRPTNEPMRIRLSESRKESILRSLRSFYAEEFDEELSAYRAERILAFFEKSIGPPVYNQAIQDARGFVMEKLEDLDTEFYEVEDPV